MSIPVRCYSCSKVIGTSKIHFDAQRCEKQQDYQHLFEKFGITRYCCKSIIMTYVPLLEKLSTPNQKQQKY